MRQGEDKVVMGAVSQQPRLLKLQPALDLDLIALRARAVLTGVVPDSLHVPLGAGLNMTPQGRRAAVDEIPGRSADMGR